ncbi:glycosyl hydrolase family 31 [Pelobium manganitolerans]|uniref:Glycosyl hydrolase family 31 n=1 Tax=Pelobium manganitolerans TaxID=1842495 RepID=A0A419S2U5_9SPHI|nr:TIM-barrel domain-containing protein [Pelobium manganitolerans]RKD13298.1 glycosyl hydrolase family 31 [Pelobium manganitolerans]
MMKKLYHLILALVILPTLVSAQVYKSSVLEKNKLKIQLDEGILYIIPLTEQAIRIRWEKNDMREDKEFVLVNNAPIPAFKTTESASAVTLETNKIILNFNKQTSAIDFTDRSGNIILSEKPGSRKLTSNTVQGQPCFVAEQGFNSPADEHLFGLGQFQDGIFDIRNLSRKLIQVNTQIAVPFLYSSKGYGILWHQYGLTYFNPTTQPVNLEKVNTASEESLVEVTTTSGTQKISQQQALYTGKFSVAADGEYSFLLDLGNMDSRHLLTIDGVPFIDQSNLWLPPAVGKLIKLKAGEHTVQIVCATRNIPKLSYKKTANETVFQSPNAKSLDYVVFFGDNADEVIANYRNLSGKVPMLPLWAYGFWQCRERYTSGDHLVNTVAEFRRRKLPVDVIVQDWQYWGKYGWGVPKFDETHYPEPEKFIKKIHDLNAHFSISVWENLDKKSEIAKAYLNKNLFIKDSPWIDIYNPETQKVHWEALNKNLFSYGVDSWWMDATEPENDALAGKETYFGLGEFYRLTYPLFVSKAVYDGQRTTNPQKRVTILTRSAFLGQQRYGTINWSGDIGWDWDAFQRQIVTGLNYALTGMPYWTTDIGGFFRPGNSQYTDEKYHEILTRWFQWGTFNTIFRMHGYQTETEPWKYGTNVESNMRKMLNLRYRLMPYIYAEAWQIHKNNATMMRPLVMDFQNDEVAVSQPFEYMFGKSFLVAPVAKPGLAALPVYLPKSEGWFNFWTGAYFNGGQTLNTAAPLDEIPLFVKAGSIIPMGKVAQSTAQLARDTIEIRVYAGADASFDLYEDEGDSYNYEKGEYSLINFKWDQKKQSLTIGAVQGGYPNALKNRVFNIVKFAGKATATTKITDIKAIAYSGKRTTVKL